MAANPRASPPRDLRGVRNGQQAQQSWIRANRGRGVGGLSGGLRGEQSGGGAGGRGVGLRRAAGRGRGGAAAAAAAAAAPAGAAAAVAAAAAAAASGRGTEAKGSPVPGHWAQAARCGEGAVLGAGAGGGWSPRRGAVRAGTTTTKSLGGRVHGGQGAGRRKGECGSHDGPRGLGFSRFCVETEPYRGAQRPGKGRGGELDGGEGPSRRGPAERKAGPEGRPGQCWEEPAAPRLGISRSGGAGDCCRERCGLGDEQEGSTHCKPGRPTAQAGGGALLFHQHRPLPQWKNCFCFIVLKFSMLYV